MPFRSVVLDKPCRHKHTLYREARDCAYARTKGGKAGTWEFYIVDGTGEIISNEIGNRLDADHEEAERDVRQQTRNAQIRRLRDEMREQHSKEWWNPYRPR